MAYCIYILAAGGNTKIGITSNLNKRLSTYATHNPNCSLYRSYQCEEAEAKRIEGCIKQIFRSTALGKSPEWFGVRPEQVDRYVSTLVFSAYDSEITPAMHGTDVASNACKIQEQILLEMSKGKKADQETIFELQRKHARIFAATFGLGVPNFELPAEIVVRDGLPVDLSHCIQDTKSVYSAVRENHVELPCDDHIWRFYHLVKLASGYYVALCTTRVSMPYLDRRDWRPERIVEEANALGWYATFHHDWSWHYPGKTGLVIFQQKTPVSARLDSWNNSFRKWLIERRKILEHASFPDQQSLAKIVDDIAHDCTFPMHIQCYEELLPDYIGKFWGSTEDDWFSFAEEYRFLLDQWVKDGGSAARVGRSPIAVPPQFIGLGAASQ